MRYCMLCGIPIIRDPEEPWLQEFRAVWVEEDNWHDVKLSGVGMCDEYPDIVDGTVPIDPFKRYDDTFDPNSMVEVSLMRSDMRHFASPNAPSRFESNPFWGWGFHSSCWNLLNTNFTPDLRHLFDACLSMPVGRDSILDWGHTYDGAASTYPVWHHGIPIICSRFANATRIPRNFISDPFHIPSLEKAIKYSSRLQDDIFQSQLNADRLNLEGDKFSHLAPELLQLISILLPTKDVRSLRLASRAFALVHLPEAFWASRFQQGNEYDHIPEVLQNPPQSWGSLYLSLEVWARDNPSMSNRRRVLGLTKRLQTTLCQMEDTPCDGSALKTWYEPSAQRDLCEQEKSSWRTAACGIQSPSNRFQFGCRTLRARVLRFSQPLELHSMFVSFVQTANGLFVSGLLFIDQDGHHALGYLHPQSIPVRLPSSQRIQGWELAFDISGVRAIAIITKDGTTSAWAGEPTGLPRWRLTEAKDISAIKAEFDALKLISLSRNSSASPPGQNDWRNNCLWYPSVPPDGLLYNGSAGDLPPAPFDHPITTLFFGGEGGQHPPSPVEIVVWVFDIAHIVGIEFIYADVSQNRHIGHTGSFDNYPAQRNFTDPEDHRISMLIDGSKGEELKSLEVQVHGSWLVGLKMHTTLGREVKTPQHPYEIDGDWIAVHPKGSKVVGLFCTYSTVLWDIGFISTNPDNVER